MLNGGSQWGLKTQYVNTWQKEGHEAIHLLCTGSYSSSRTQHTGVVIWWSNSAEKESNNEGTWTPSQLSRGCFG